MNAASHPTAPRPRHSRADPDVRSSQVVVTIVSMPSGPVKRCSQSEDEPSVSSGPIAAPLSAKVGANASEQPE